MEPALIAGIAGIGLLAFASSRSGEQDTSGKDPVPPLEPPENATDPVAAPPNSPDEQIPYEDIPPGVTPPPPGASSGGVSQPPPAAGGLPQCAEADKGELMVFRSVQQSTTLEVYVNGTYMGEGSGRGRGRIMVPLCHGTYDVEIRSSVGNELWRVPVSAGMVTQVLFGSRSGHRWLVSRDY